MKYMAFIPARAGSRGVPGKNTRRLMCGKPLYQWAIDAAKGVPEIGYIIVSTDDPDVLANCDHAYERPAELCGDTVHLEPIIADVLKDIDHKPEHIIILQPTSPLRTAEDIQQAISQYEKYELDSLFSATLQYPSFSWKWGKTRDWLGNKIGWTRPYTKRPNRQELDQVFVENGAIYITRTDLLLKHMDRVAGKVGVYIMGPEHRYQIDDETDWLVVEALMAKRLGMVHV
jgi:CMP-N,N'-diacetyllegionaminic acid synthase